MSKWETVEMGEMEGLKYEIINNPYGGCNGYITFPSRPAKEEGYRGILTYVPVHGGITFASKDKDGGGFTYGFDTAHHYSKDVPADDPEWIRGQIDIMRRGILLAAEVEDEYLLAEGNDEKRAEICQRVVDVCPDQMLDNFGISINLLFGRL